MFNRILVPVDGSDHAAAAAETALDLAERFDASVLGLHVVDVRLIEGTLVQAIGSMWGDLPLPARQGELLEALERRGRGVLDDFEQRARARGRTFESTLETGVVADVVVERSRSVDLVVLGRRGEHAAFGDAPLGSTVHAVVRRAPKPILVVPRRTAPLDRPLVAYDGSEHAGKALEVGVAYATGIGRPLHVVTVADRREDAERIAGQAADYAGGHGLDPALHAVEGEDAVETILDVAREIESDLLVMGAYGGGRLRELLLGSTTEAILGRCGRAVLLYR